MARMTLAEATESALKAIQEYETLRNSEEYFEAKVNLRVTSDRTRDIVSMTMHGMKKLDEDYAKASEVFWPLQARYINLKHEAKRQKRNLQSRVKYLIHNASEEEWDRREDEINAARKVADRIIW